MQAMILPEPAAPLAKHCLDYKQVLHACCQVSRLHLRDAWPSRVVVRMSGCKDTLAIQAGADILCQPVYSQSHWGLLVVHRDQAAHFYDGGAGMQHRVCKDHAWAHLAELRELQWLSKELALVCANTGTQAELLRAPCRSLLRLLPGNGA